MSAQRRALELAVARYADQEGQFELRRWTEAFESSKPEAINHVVEVTGGYQMLVNHLVEALRTGAKLTGLEADAAGKRRAARSSLQPSATTAVAGPSERAPRPVRRGGTARDRRRPRAQ